MKQTRGVLAVAFLLGCAAADDEPADGSVGATDSPSCPPGYEGCQCVYEPEGPVCLQGLTCASDLCVALPKDPTGPQDTGDPTDPTDPTGGAEDSAGSADAGDDSGEPIDCDNNFDCPSTDVCTYGSCRDAWSQWYDLEVLTFEPCPLDGWGDGEMYFVAFSGQAEPYRSGDVPCAQGGWPDIVPIDDITQYFYLEFWELDAFKDDFITSLCWDTHGTGTCGPVPKVVLHEYGYTGSLGAADEYFVSLEFIPIGG